MNKLSFGINQLKSGHVQLINFLDIAPVIEVNSGSYLSGISPCGRKIYLPKDDWRAIPSKVLKWGYKSDTNISSCVAFFNFGMDLIEALRIKLLQSLEPNNNPSSRSKVLRDISFNCLNLLYENHQLVCSKIEHDAVHINPPFMSCTAFDYGANSFVGLHIDNEWLRNSNIGDSINKNFGVLSVNFGTKERYIFIVNRTPKQISMDVSESSSWLSTTEKLKDDFFERLPSYPIIRIRLEPGQGYFCNPQNLIHDGGTNSANAPDVALLIFGYFNWIH